MALTIGTNCGFVGTAPTVDPGGTDTYLSEEARAMKDTTSASETLITEMGFWFFTDIGSSANYDIGIYSDAGSGEPEELQEADTSNNTGSSGGWKTVTGLNWTVSANTTYWLAVQFDSSFMTGIVRTSSGGSGDAYLQNQTSLPADWGSSDSTDADAKLGIYALIGEAAPATSNYGLNISDDWTDIDETLINIGDTWRRVTEACVNVGDAWKSVPVP